MRNNSIINSAYNWAPMVKKYYPNGFWITNISKRIVSLSDLNISVPARASVNLLDKKHYQFTEEQLVKSAQSGSLFKKQNSLVVRIVPPEMPQKDNLPWQEDAVFQTKHRSTIKVEEVKYEELNIKDEDFANENAESAEADNVGRWKKGGENV